MAPLAPFGGAQVLGPCQSGHPSVLTCAQPAIVACEGSAGPSPDLPCVGRHQSQHSGCLCTGSVHFLTPCLDGVPQALDGVQLAVQVALRRLQVLQPAGQTGALVDRV